MPIKRKLKKPLPPRRPKIEVLETRHPIFQDYRPFILGGDVSPWVQFEVQAVDVKLPKQFRGYVFHDSKHSGEWRVHERVTGGLIGVGPTRKEAIADAESNIRETPDLKKQVAEMAASSKWQGRLTMPADEALAKLAKSKK